MHVRARARVAALITMTTLAVSLPLLLVAQDTPRFAGPTERGFLLPNGWTVSPAGVQVELTDLPLNILPLADGRHALVATSGYNAHELSLVDLDTAKVIGPASYGAGSPYKGFANQFAAMPSLHFGWALVIAWAVLLATKSRWRYLVVAHPVITLAAIVLTANHYWLDAVVATVLFAFALGVDALIEQLR